MAETQPEKPDMTAAFIARLYALNRRGDLAALATLRRGLGKRPGESPAMYQYVIPYCSRYSDRRQNDFFLVAALYASHRGAPGAPDPWRNNLGASFHALARKTGSAGVERRFLALLNAQREDLDSHLQHAVSHMKAHGVTVDWEQLLRDLAGWSWESRAVQRRWSQAFWRFDPDASAGASADSGADSSADASLNDDAG